MAKSHVMAKAPVRTEKKGGGITAVQGLAAGAALVGAPSLFLLLGVLLAPGMLCLISERTPGRPVARAALLAGHAHSIAPAWHLWSMGLTLDHALSLLSDVGTLARTWCAGAFGWLICELAPLGVNAVLEVQSERHQKKLIERRKMLIKEWNLKAVDEI